MNDKVAFVDTNIWLYAFDERKIEPDKYTKANALFEDIVPVVSPQVVNEFVNNLIKKLRFPAYKVDGAFLRMRQMSIWQPFAWDTYELAARLRQRYNLSFFDSLIVAAALEAGVDALYSEDMQDGLLVDDKLHIRNPLK